MGKLIYPRTCRANGRNNYPFNEITYFLLEASLPHSCLQSFHHGTVWSCPLFSLDLQKHIFFPFSFYHLFPHILDKTGVCFSQGLRTPYSIPERALHTHPPLPPAGRFQHPLPNLLALLFTVIIKGMAFIFPSLGSWLLCVFPSNANKILLVLPPSFVS